MKVDFMNYEKCLASLKFFGDKNIQAKIQPWLMENFNSDPAKIGKDGFDSSQPEYNWAQSATIELLLERYKEPSAFDQVQAIK